MAMILKFCIQASECIQATDNNAFVPYSRLPPPPPQKCIPLPLTLSITPPPPPTPFLLFTSKSLLTLRFIFTGSKARVKHKARATAANFKQIHDFTVQCILYFAWSPVQHAVTWRRDDHQKKWQKNLAKTWPIWRSLRRWRLLLTRERFLKSLPSSISRNLIRITAGMPSFSREFLRFARTSRVASASTKRGEVPCWVRTVPLPWPGDLGMGDRGYHHQLKALQAKHSWVVCSW